MAADLAAQIGIQLEPIQKIVGLIGTMGVAIYVAGVTKPHPLIADNLFFPQAKKFAVLTVGVFATVSWLFLGSSKYVQVLLVMALVLLVAGLVGFFAVALAIERRSSGEVSGRTTKFVIAFFGYAVAFCCGVSAVAELAMAYVNNPAQPAGSPALVKPSNYSATAVVVGRRIIAGGGATTFTRSSGQQNFGCDDRRSFSVTYPLPEGATLEGQPTASWQNVSNVSGQSAPAVQIAGSQVLATATIAGLPSQNLVFARNCPGGGHAELVISGTYRLPDQRSPEVRNTLVSHLSSAAPGPVDVTLPSSSEFELSSVEIAIVPEGTEAIQGTAIMLTPLTPDKTSADGQFQAKIRTTATERVLELRLVK